jgi:asparagine synthase (glutamine-hydrolysing)
MCGIAGIVDATPRLETRVAVERMTETLARRGPDAMAIRACGAAVLGFRRLAIVDLAGGNQPMHAPEDDVTLVANGEIYNHAELRRELEAKGFAFHTRCDVEVILHGYRAWGAGVAERLYGMFAFAVWDGRRRSLLLGRDRLGQKPLYYARVGDRFLFASEVKAILAALDATPSVDPRALARYLALDFVPTPWCIFEGISKLPAAHYLKIGPEVGSGEDARPTAYWELPVPSADAPSLAEATSVTAKLFETAVARRLMSDVPIGLLLSGGLDSTVVGAAMRRLGAPLETFSLGFDEPEFDESSSAGAVAKWLGTRHHEQRFSARALPAALPDILEWLDEPFADPSLLAVHALSAFTSTRVKVALGGDGADELFAGYDVFLAAKLDGWTRAAGRLRQWGLDGLARVLPVRERHFSLDFRVRQFARGLAYDEAARPAAYTLGVSADEIGQLLGGTLHEDVLDDARAAAAPLRTGALDIALRQYARFFLESDVLFKVDRAGMAHGLEIRSPFLDHDLAGYAASLPGTLKLPGLTRKSLLRHALARDVPHAVLARPKQGFSVPIVRWINGELRGWFDEILLDPSGYTDGLIERPAVERLLARHRRHEANLRKPIWNLTMLMLWKSRWLRREAGAIGDGRGVVGRAMALAPSV